MKYLKIPTILLLCFFAALLVYANVRKHSITESLPKMNLVTYDLSGGLSSDTRGIEKKISGLPGVSACSEVGS